MSRWQNNWICRIALIAWFSAFGASANGQMPGECKLPAIAYYEGASLNSTAGYIKLGTYFGRQNQFACARAAFQNALKLDPSSVEALLDYGLALLSSNDPQTALAELKIASWIAPEAPQIHIALGTALKQLQQPDNALREFKLALNFDPANVTALDDLAQILIAQGRYAAALGYLKNAPPNHDLELDAAIAHLKSGNLDRAVQLLSELVKEEPSSTQAHANLGIAYTQQDRYPEAAAEFRKAMQLDSRDDAVCISYVKALASLSEFGLALPVITEYCKRRPFDHEGLYLLGVVNRGLGRYAEAETNFRQAIELKPDDYDLRYNHGFVLAKLGHEEAARREFEKALQLKPESSEARYQLALALRSLGRPDESRQQMEEFQRAKEEETEKNLAATITNQATEAMRMGETQRAVDIYHDALSHDPKNARTYYDLALALDRLGDVTGEREALARAQSLDDNLAPIHNQLGLLDAQAGEDASAETQFRKAISLNPQYAEAQNNLAVLFGRQGNVAMAEDFLRAAVEDDPQYEQALVNLGLILASQSRFTEAGHELDAALRMKPDDAQALRAKAMILDRQKPGADK